MIYVYGNRDGEIIEYGFPNAATEQRRTVAGLIEPRTGNFLAQGSLHAMEPVSVVTIPFWRV
jgi:hypothetical protein